MRLFSHEEFAARRTDAQDKAISALLPTIARALRRYGQTDTGNEWWRSILVPARSLFNDMIREDTGLTRLRTADEWAPIAAALRESLAKTGKDTTARTIATWVSTYVINAAAEASVRMTDRTLALVWVSMRDDNVRHSHQDMDGQRRPVDDTFDLEGTKTPGPGYPVGPLELWINCRCHLRPARVEAMVAAADSGPDPGIVIVALPTETDPTNSLHGPDSEPDPETGEMRPLEGHMTLCWLGKPGENPNLDITEVNQALAVAARNLRPFSAAVDAVDTLGDDGALVWKLSTESAAVAVRDALLSHEEIEDAVNAVEQHPSFIPHVTIGYDMILNGDAADTLTSVDVIGFDRVALWDGEKHYEYRLGDEEAAMTAATEERPDALADLGVPWHGVLAPEGEWSGDGRMFADGALTFRDLPLPLTWQKASADGHGGSVVVAKIERLARVDGQMRSSGHYLTTPEADEALGLVADFGRFGVSVDADDAEYELSADGDDRITFTKARISSASQVPIPAFDTAWLALGDPPDGFMPDDCDPASPDYDECMRSKGAEPGGDTQVGMGAEFKDYDAEQRKNAHTVPGTDSYPIEDCADLKNAIQAIGRADDPAAVKRHIKTQKNRLGCPDVEIPSDWADETDTFADIEQFMDTKRGVVPFVDVAPGRTEDGPGWLTHPVDTDRLRDYWVSGPGAAKIGWGTPGDFNRCRVAVAEYVKPQHLAGYCANRHYDALGFWPGRPVSGDTVPFDAAVAPALSIVASSGWCAPSEWFKDPEFAEGDGRMVQQPDGAWAAPLTVTEDGHVFAHVAYWESCHIDPQYAGACVAPPHSNTGYAYFLTGEILTDQGPIPVGSLTIDTGHARPGNARRAMAHYDNTGAVVAYVTCGEDAYGIWISGCVSPNATEGQVVALRGAKLSGDWRRFAASPDLEMIAALAVNAGGFSITRTSVGIAAGLQTSLVAAGMVDTAPPAVDLPALARAVEGEITARSERRSRLAALAQRVNGSD